jgi:hypothetical protein
MKVCVGLYSVDAHGLAAARAARRRVTLSIVQRADEFRASIDYQLAADYCAWH